MPHNFLPKAYFENQFVDFKEANISIATHAFHYGTAAFGGMRGIPNPKNPKEILLFRLDRHAHRLSQSAKFLMYDLDADFIAEKIIEFVQINNPQTPFYIRPLVYISELGIAPRLHNIEKNFLIYGLEMGDYLSPSGVKVCFSSWQRSADAAIPSRGKITGTYINSAMAKTEAVNRGFDEALMLTTAGYVSEASAMNIFMVRDGKLITPSMDQDLLEGITRDSIMHLAKAGGIEVVERQISKSELIIADEVFLTGTAAKVTPVAQIEQYTMPTEHPITDLMRSKLSKITEASDAVYDSWITKVSIA